MGSTSLGNIINTASRLISLGTIYELVISEPGTVIIKFDPNKVYVNADDKHFPFKRAQSNNPKVRK
jgi:hypothetical protein